jgi:hypothetical protein
MDEIEVEARSRCLAAVLHGDMHASRFSGNGGLGNFDEFHLDALMGFGGGTSQQCSDECQYESGGNGYKAHEGLLCESRVKVRWKW